MKILCTGDIHIGRRSSRVPTHLDGPALSCGSAWLRVVDRAIAEEADLVCVTGDLIDRANRYLEAIGTLEAGIRKLVDAGIEVVMVAGNHDYDVLPALVDGLDAPNVRLLGRGGQWERYTVERRGTRVHIDGWSFPHSHQLSSPLRAYQPIHDGNPVLALLHADLEVRGSRYAPILVSEIRRHPEVLFLLGHVHQPRFVREDGGAKYVYPGSPQPIDRAETGRHGAMLLHVRNRDIEVEPIALSTVRYEPLDLNVDGIEAPEALDAALAAAVGAALDAIVPDSDHLRLVRFRVRLVGPTRIARELEGRMAELSQDLELPRGDVLGTVESFWSQVSPAHDLDALAAGVGAPAILAGLLNGSRRDERLTNQLKRLVAEIHGSRSFAELGGGHEDLAAMEREAEDELRRAATILLDQLIAQKEARG